MNIRPVKIEDTENVASVIYKAFSGIADKHNFPYDFPTIESAVGFAQMAISNPTSAVLSPKIEGNFSARIFCGSKIRLPESVRSRLTAIRSQKESAEN